MDVRFLPPEMRRLDELELDALALPLFEDERPLRGLAGHVDWRLCGMLSRTILRGRVSGAPGERMLVPLGRRMRIDRLFLFGVGTHRAFAEGGEEGMARYAAEVVHTLDRAGSRSAAVALPLTAGADAGLVMQRLLDEAGEGRDEMVLLVEPEAQRLMAPVLANERRRRRAAR